MTLYYLFFLNVINNMRVTDFFFFFFFFTSKNSKRDLISKDLCTTVSLIFRK